MDYHNRCLNNLFILGICGSNLGFNLLTCMSRRHMDDCVQCTFEIYIWSRKNFVAMHIIVCTGTDRCSTSSAALLSAHSLASIDTWCCANVSTLVNESVRAHFSSFSHSPVKLKCEMTMQFSWARRTRHPTTSNGESNAECTEQLALSGAQKCVDLCSVITCVVLCYVVPRWNWKRFCRLFLLDRRWKRLSCNCAFKIFTFYQNLTLQLIFLYFTFQ